MDNKKIAETKKEIDKLTQQLEKVREKSAKLEVLGGTEKQFESLGYDAEILEDKIAKAQERLYELQMTNAGGTINEGLNQATKAAKGFHTALQKGAKKSNGLLKTMASRLKGIALSLLVFNWITKGFNAMVSAMKEGFQNLAQYSSDYNRSMSELKSSTAQLKNGLAAAFEPIANMVIPYLTQMVGWLNTAVDAMSRFLAALQGKSTYTRAKKQVIDYAKSLNTASASAKGALASFDQLNVLNKSDGASTVTAGGELTEADAFETAEVGIEIKNFAEEILEAIKPFKEAITTWWQDIDFEPLTTAFNNLKEACEPFGGYLYEGLLWFLTDVLLPLGTWTIEDALPAFFDLLSAALDFFSTVLEGLKPYAEWLWNEFLQPIAAWTGEKVIEGIKVLTEKLKEFTAWCKSDKSHAELMRAVILGFFAGIMTYYTVKKIVEVIGYIKTAFDKFITVASGGISPIAICAIAIGALAAAAIYLGSKWGELSKGEKILAGLAAAALVAAVAVAAFHTAWSVGTAAVAILAGLTLLGLSAAVFSRTADADMSVGKSFNDSHDFTSSPLPKLADGAVIQGGRPFAAILGDQRFGQTNIETPLPTMVAAFKQALAESGGSGGDINLTVNLDGNAVYKSVVKQDRMYRKTTGNSAFLF